MPLLLDGRLLGEIGIDADPAGQGTLVDAKRLTELLVPRLGSTAAQQLQALLASADPAAPKLPIADIPVDGLSLSLDMASLSLNAQVAGATRARRDVSFSAVTTPEPEAFDPQAAIAAGAGITLLQSIGPIRDGPDYAARPLNGIVEAYATIGGFEGVTLTAAAETLGSFRTIRWRDVALIHDRYDSALRLTAGEVTPRFFGFQTGGDVVGVGIERRFTDIRPFENIRSTGRRQIVLQQDSRVEFIVNGQSLGERRLPAGPYDLSDFPLAQGGNDIQLLIEGADGQREILDYGVLLAPTLLGPGVVDFGAFAGYPTTGNLSRARTPVATGFVEAGITSGLTLGGGVQVGRGVTQLAARASTGFGSTVMSTTAALSRNGTLQLDGHAIAFDLRHLGQIANPNDLTISVTAERRSTNFTSIGQPIPQNPERWRIAGSTGFQHPSGYGLTVGGSFIRAREPQRDSATLIATAFGRIRQLSISLTGSRQFGDAAETRLLLGFALPFGGRYNANLRTDLLNRDREVSLNRTLGPALREWGGLLQARQGEDRDSAEARFQFRGQRVALEASHVVTQPRLDAAPQAHESRWRLNTFLGMADGLFGIGRDGRQGFAVVRRHPTLKGADLSLRNGGRQVGESDWLGNIVVPVERAYSVLQLGITADPLPVGYDLGAGRLNLLPGFGAGYGVTVGSDASLTVLGVFLGRRGQPLSLISGELTAPKLKQPIPFFTNSNGRFAANRVAPGGYDVMVQGRKVGRLEVQRGDDNLVQMGRVALDLD